MRTKYKLIFLMAISLQFIACEKHDMMDDDVIVGQMAPQVYWEPASSTIKAGENVPFNVQYYTTSTEDIDHLEVWYNIVEDESKAIRKSHENPYIKKLYEEYFKEPMSHQAHDLLHTKYFKKHKI